jgi:hypothetical protein
MGEDTPGPPVTQGPEGPYLDLFLSMSPARGRESWFPLMPVLTFPDFLV